MLLLLLQPHLLPDDSFEEFLNNDYDNYDPKKHSEYRYIFDELNKIKENFKHDLKQTENVDKNNDRVEMTWYNIYQTIEGNKIRINKLRVIIELISSEKPLITHNLHKSNGVSYVVGRWYWIDKNGKKYRKFSKTLGSEETVLVGGEIPPHDIKGVKEELIRLMWDQYKFEYKE